MNWNHFLFFTHKISLSVTLKKTANTNHVAHANAVSNRNALRLNHFCSNIHSRRRSNSGWHINFKLLSLKWKKTLECHQRKPMKGLWPEKSLFHTQFNLKNNQNLIFYNYKEIRKNSFLNDFNILLIFATHLLQLMLSLLLY